MPNSVEFSRRAAKFIRDLNDRILYQRLIQTIEPLKHNPLPVGCKKIQGSIHTYRLRVGDYRILYEVLSNRIVITDIGHRREIYR